MIVVILVMSKLIPNLSIRTGSSYDLNKPNFPSLFSPIIFLSQDAYKTTTMTIGTEAEHFSWSRHIYKSPVINLLITFLSPKGLC